MSSPSSTSAAPDLFELAADHEQVVFANDAATGLRAIIAIHSTALGPALGGTRFYPYAATSHAIEDVLNLSRGMSYKAALAGLDLGGGKAVILGDPRTLKSEPLLRAYGRFVESLNGRYYTACDVGTFSADMDHIARETSFVTGRTTAHGGAGAPRSSRRTASSRGCGPPPAPPGQRQPGRSDRWGAGVGKVGRHLVDHLLEDGPGWSSPTSTPRLVADIVAAHPEVQVAESADALVRRDLDIYAPCALGGALTDEVVEVLTARIVCGAANNQLAHPGVEKALEERDILYAPDYCVNAGGLIQVADEREGDFSFARAKERATHIYDTTRAVFARAERDGVARHRGGPDRRAADAGGQPPTQRLAPHHLTPDR